jgi:zinc protease
MIDEVKKIVDEELETLRQAPPSTRELERIVNKTEADFYLALERTGGFGGKADRLNAYYVATGEPDYFARDLARYRGRSVADLQAALRTWLPADRRVELTVLPATP